ncbi:transposase, partial [Parasediminibacterium sp. JCM 36343]|uniref:transposase n=1 Tax=Parasediminibacterium sp. JCM 36343 TaxID=3374279 RepID=UPI00397C291F
MSLSERRKFKASSKAKVAIEAIKEQKTFEEICKIHEVHPTQVNLWKKEFLANASQLFEPSAKTATD